MGVFWCDGWWGGQLECIVKWVCMVPLVVGVMNGGLRVCLCLCVCL